MKAPLHLLKIHIKKKKMHLLFVSTVFNHLHPETHLMPSFILGGLMRDKDSALYCALGSKFPTWQFAALSFGCVATIGRCGLIGVPCAAA